MPYTSKELATQEFNKIYSDMDLNLGSDDRVIIRSAFHKGGVAVSMSVKRWGSSYPQQIAEKLFKNGNIYDLVHGNACRKTGTYTELD